MPQFAMEIAMIKKETVNIIYKWSIFSIAIVNANAMFVFWEAQLGMQPLTASRCLEMEETLHASSRGCCFYGISWDIMGISWDIMGITTSKMVIKGNSSGKNGD